MIWIILFFGLGLRLISINQSLWLDEAINVLATQKFSLLGMITEYAKADFHPPGFFIILWIWTKIFGISEISSRLPSVIFGVLAIYIVYLIGQKIHSRTLGIFSALLLAVNPLHIYYSQEARMYALATLAVLINIFLLIKLIKGERINLFLLILSDLFILASDYIAYFIFPAQLFFLLFIKRKEIIKKWIIALSVALVLGIWWLPLFLGQLNVGSIASSNLPTWKFVAGAFDLKTLPLTFVKFIIGRISLADKLLYATILLPVLGLFGYLLWKGIQSVSGFYRQLFTCWIIIPLLIATLVSFVIPVYNYFRVLYVLPGIILLVSIGTLSLEKKVKYVFLAGTVLIELFCTYVYLFNSDFQREDWRGLVSFFKDKPTALILFESSGNLPPFDYYAKNNLKAKGALKDFPAKNESDIAFLEETEKDVYLVEYLVEISDPQRLVGRKLLGLGYEQIDTKNFTGVGFVYHYVKK